ncbi:MAG: methionine ABC transporter permease [Arachnia sp.]
MLLLQTKLTAAQIVEVMSTALLETLIMVGISGVATVILGIPLGVVLFTTQRGGMSQNRVVSFVLSSVLVNITRSVPYAILVVALTKVTQSIVGTSLGPVAMSVSLTIAAVPFLARLVETAFREVHPGKLDAAHAMGSTKLQSIVKVLVPEAMPAIVAAITTTIVTLIGYSAMAGLVGGGGLGRLGYVYGFQRWMLDVMLYTVIVLVVMVQVIQFVGDRISKAIDHR